MEHEKEEFDAAAKEAAKDLDPISSLLGDSGSSNSDVGKVKSSTEALS